MATITNPDPDSMLVQAAKLRRRAAQCREMARGALSDIVADELETLAEEFERDATTLEVCAERNARLALASA